MVIFFLSYSSTFLGRLCLGSHCRLLMNFLFSCQWNAAFRTAAESTSHFFLYDLADLVVELGRWSYVELDPIGE